MRVRFWGTRGSLAVPGPDTVRYGGNTSCVQLESDAGTLVVLDCGTGARGLGNALTADRGAGAGEGNLLVSHTHWDHIQGFPFFAPLFVPGDRWEVYGPRGLGPSLRDTLAGQMQYTYFPVTLEAMAADIRYHNLVEGSFQVGDIHVSTRYLNHPVLTLAYRMEADGVSVAYACDHEPYDGATANGDSELRGEDRAHADFLAGADLLIHDAQYTTEEYVDKVGWGHSTAEYALRVAREGGVRRLALTHHDPMRSDDALDRVIDALGDPGGVDVFAAAEGLTVEVSSGKDSSDARTVTGATGSADRSRSALREDRAIEGHRIVLAVSPSPDAQIIKDIAAEDGVELTRSTASMAANELGESGPSLILVSGDAEGLGVADEIRARPESWAREAPIVAVASAIGEAEAITDWLVSPFSPEYARARIQSWLLRRPSRWVRAPRTEDESQRLEALRELGILDTEPDERFDRITRLAAALLESPVSLVTLVDQDRQWFKSVEGWDRTETSREQSFCAHAIHGAGPFVVHDTHADDRFADNPLVTGSPYVRFYAGCPLSLPSGQRVGTLCVIDERARQLTPRELHLLRDLADLAEEELARYAGA